MTRYARAKRDKRVQEGNATPWSELAKTVLPLSKTAPASGDVAVNEVESRSDDVPKVKTISKAKKKEKDSLSTERKEKETASDKIAEKKKKKKKRLHNPEAATTTSSTTNEIVSETLKKKKKLKKPKAAEVESENSAVPTDSTNGNGINNKKTKKRKKSDGKADANEEVEQPKRKLKKLKSALSSESSSAKPKKEKKEVPEPPARPPQFFTDIIKKLAQDEACKTLDGLKRTVRRMVEDGELIGKEAGLVVRKWKTHERQRMHKEALRSNQSTAADEKDVKQEERKPKKRQEIPEDSAKKQKVPKLDTEAKPQASKTTSKFDTSLKQTPGNAMSLSDNELTEMADKMSTQTLFDVKKLVNSYVDQGKLSRKDAGMVVKKWRDRERRRVNRGIEKLSNAVCFHCRQPGHQLADCPSVDSTESGSGICFKCGSTEHKSSRCSRKDVKGFPYATCFVCKQQGHLSRDCEQNPNGIYPDGGSCNLCGSQKHLRRDCPTLLETSAPQTMTIAPVLNSQTMRSADDDDAIFYELDKLPVHNKGVKVVKF